MTITEWLDNPIDYHIGVQLYKKQGLSNKALYRYFDRGPSKSHINKLRYELQKFVEPAKVIKKPVVKKITLPTSGYDRYYLENLPIEIRPVRERAQILYIEMRSIKLQLNDLAPKMEEAAFALQMQLWYKRKENISCWQQINYFLENKKLLPKKFDSLDDVTPARLLQLKANMHSQITNHSNTVAKNKSLLLKATDLKDIAKYERAINRSNELIIKKKVALTEIENKIYLNG